MDYVECRFNAIIGLILVDLNHMNSSRCVQNVQFCDGIAMQYVKCKFNSII